MAYISCSEVERTQEISELSPKGFDEFKHRLGTALFQCLAQGFPLNAIDQAYEEAVLDYYRRFGT